MVAKSTGTRYPYQTIFGMGMPGGYGSDENQITLGTRVRFNANGRIIGVRYYRDFGSYGPHNGFILETPYNGNLQRACQFPLRDAETGPAEGEWQNAYFSKMLPVANGDERTIAVQFPHGRYYRVLSGLSGAPVINGDLEAIEDGDGGDNGVYAYDVELYLGNTFSAGLYMIDVLFLADSEVA